MIRVIFILLFMNFGAEAQDYDLDNLRTIRNEPVTYDSDKSNIIITTTNKICYNCLLQLDSTMTIDTNSHSLYLVMVAKEYNVLSIKQFKRMVAKAFTKNSPYINILVNIDAKNINILSPFMHYQALNRKLVYLSYECLFQKNRVYSLKEILR